MASLVGQHLTNVEIAERLFISVPTVKSRLSRTFAKLGIVNRGQLAARRAGPRSHGDEIASSVTTDEGSSIALRGRAICNRARDLALPGQVGAPTISFDIKSPLLGPIRPGWIRSSPNI